ncbi:carboxypeptidase-like regulatory domain-containing protein [Nannocystis bainbridge]|uniref:Carboxypeptidase-like regulatory domain-containing protein n=1 Tax=Nannocystis bainbridge TaxID=2995303 RepID=A0ABT5DPA3_9BACT|nr:carboxypeptidase-like regulatory domain-containing protein [Nannocystis bainbridge]MDC0715481.1 carboxypeptidase-like regulatory domain-containing protein [Nannocystis bainbridge]
MRRAAVVAALLALLAALAVWLGTGARSTARPGARKNKPTATQVTAAVEVGAPTQGVARRADVDRSGRGVVQGRIVDRDGSPVSDGRIILHCLAGGTGRSAPIDGGVVELGAEGDFSGPGCRGIVCAELRHPTMVPRDPWVLEPNRAPVTLVAQSLGRVVGSVSDGEGRAVAGAQIWVRRGADDDPGALPPFTSRNTVSDGEGFFSFARVEKPPCDPCGEASGRCEPGDARDVPTYASLMLIARAPGFRATEKEVSVDDEDGWQLVLAPPLTPLQGTVTDAEGRAYARARVLARAQARGYEVHQARVEAGQFSLAELGEGSYDLRVVQDGVELAVSAGHVAGEAVTLVGSVPALGRAVTVAVIRRGSDLPVVGAVVDGGPFAGARTDEEGTIGAAAVLPGTYTLGVRVRGLRSQRGQVTVPADDGGPWTGRMEVDDSP